MMHRSALPIALPIALALSACHVLPTGAPDPYDIGVIRRAVTTSSPEAQLWFDRGLALTYGFNHEQALVCFERAAQADPDCAMAYWGTAYALGPNYNAPQIPPEALAAAVVATERAVAELDDESPIEHALVEALRARYSTEDRAAADRAFADEMRSIAQRFPDDPEVAAVTAEALMQLRPWQLWSPDGVAAPETPEIRAHLERSLERWPDHPALCHLYIHAMEAGPHVADAIPAARRLESLAPGMGHLVHMPSHIYVWTGMYDDVVRVNLLAVEADEAYVDLAGRENFYTLYRIHNYHFVAYGGMWEGQRELALEAAWDIVDEIPDSLLAQIPDLVDVFTATPYHVMVRFGMWEELLREPEPTGESHLAANAVWRYARGVALASLGRVDEAAREHELFRAAWAAVPETRLLFQNPVHQILAVADKVLEGEIAYRRGEYDTAFALLREAVVLDEKLNYDEPWGWMEPARHALGALLTEQGRFAEAVAVYEANLTRYPENGWALHGLAECLRGLGRAAEAAAVEARFEDAWARADVEIPGSCYCKTQ